MNSIDDIWLRWYAGLITFDWNRLVAQASSSDAILNHLKIEEWKKKLVKLDLLLWRKETKISGGTTRCDWIATLITDTQGGARLERETIYTIFQSINKLAEKNWKMQSRDFKLASRTVNCEEHLTANFFLCGVQMEIVWRAERSTFTTAPSCDANPISGFSALAVWHDENETRREGCKRENIIDGVQVPLPASWTNEIWYGSAGSRKLLFTAKSFPSTDSMHHQNDSFYDSVIDWRITNKRRIDGYNL